MGERALLVLGVLLAAATAHADPDWATCADAAIATAPEPEHARLVTYLHGPSAADWDQREATALAADATDPLDALLIIAEDAHDAGDATRVVHLADVMEAAAPKLPAVRWPPDGVAREARLAQVEALAGRATRARAHLAAGDALAAAIQDPVPSVYRELWTAAILLASEPDRAREQAAYLATRSGRGDLGITARLMSYAGVGRALLPVVDAAGDDRTRVLHMMLEGVEARHDYALAADILAKLPANERLADARHVWSMAGDRRRDDAVVAIVTAALAGIDDASVDDSAREDIIAAASDVGLAAAVVPVAAKIANPWNRAKAEAEIAEGLAATDKRAAIALAHAALARAKTKGWRTDVSNDTSAISATTADAAIALARAGAIAEARKLSKSVWPIDALLGVRDDPKAVATWWTHASLADRAYVLAHAARGDRLLGDPAYLAPHCTP